MRWARATLIAAMVAAAPATAQMTQTEQAPRAGDPAIAPMTMPAVVPAVMVAVPQGAAQGVAGDALAAVADMPVPPGGAALGFVPPERDAVGYRTPNRDLGANEALWHLRAALNVAALQCRGTGDRAIAAGYDSLLRAHSRTLLAAHDEVQVRYRLRRGAGGDAAFDDDMTRLYNFFAQPPVRDGFCSTARIVLEEAGRVAPEALREFAPNALVALEAPFLRFFAAYDAYRDALAAWRTVHPPVVIATAAPVAVVPRP